MSKTVDGSSRTLGISEFSVKVNHKVLRNCNRFKTTFWSALEARVSVVNDPVKLVEVTEVAPLVVMHQVTVRDLDLSICLLSILNAPVEYGLIYRSHA